MPKIENNITEVQYLRNGAVCRKISIVTQGREFVVIEQEISEDLITKLLTWNNKFVLSFPNRHLARTCYLGLMSAAMYEEGNTENAPTVAIRQSLDHGMGINRSSDEREYKHG